MNYVDKLLIKIAVETRPVFNSVHANTIKTAFDIEEAKRNMSPEERAAIDKILEGADQSKVQQLKDTLGKMVVPPGSELAAIPNVLKAFEILGPGAGEQAKNVINGSVQRLVSERLGLTAPATPAAQPTSAPGTLGAAATQGKALTSQGQYLADQGYYTPSKPSEVGSGVVRPEYQGKTKDEIVKMEADAKVKADQAKVIENLKLQAEIAFSRGDTRTLQALAQQHPEVSKLIEAKLQEADKTVAAAQGNIPAGAVARNQAGQFFDADGNMIAIKDGKTVTIGKAPPMEGFAGIDPRTGKHVPNFQQRNPAVAPMPLNRPLMQTAGVTQVGQQAGLDPNKQFYKAPVTPEQAQQAGQLRQRANALSNNMNSLNKLINSTTDPANKQKLIDEIGTLSNQRRSLLRQADATSGSQDHYMSLVKQYGKNEADKRMNPNFYSDRKARTDALWEQQKNLNPSSQRTVVDKANVQKDQAAATSNALRLHQSNTAAKPPGVTAPVTQAQIAAENAIPVKMKPKAPAPAAMKESKAAPGAPEVLPKPATEPAAPVKPAVPAPPKLLDDDKIKQVA